MKNIQILIILIVLFNSCEYDLSKTNYLEIEPPPETRYFELNLIPESDTIKIFEETEFKISANTDGLDILQGAVFMQGKSLTEYVNNGILTINPTEFTPGYSTLTLALYIKSGSGSIAESVGMEGYYLEKNWTVVLDGRPAPKLIPAKMINEDGFLAIEWEKCNQYNFIAYEISTFSGNQIIEKTIHDPNQNYYIDRHYVGGEYSFTVSCRVANDHTWGERLNFFEEPPQLKIEEIGFDSLHISWNKSRYNAKYRLSSKYYEPIYFNSAEDTSCTIPQIGFGKWTDFYLCTKSQFENGWPDESYSCDITSQEEYYQGERLISANWPEFGYNYNENVLYSNRNNELKTFNIDTYTILNSIEVDNLIYEGSYSCPTNSSKIATITNHEIYVFENQNLSNPIVFQYKESGAYSIDHFLLTNNGRLALAYNNKYRIFDINSQQELITIKFNDYPYYSKWACITTSQDAKYMCIVTNNGIKIYNVEGDKAKLQYTDFRDYRSAYFNPENPNQLYLTLNEERGIEIRDPSNFELINKIDIPSKMVIRNIDLTTKNILLTDYENLFIIDQKTGNTIFKIKCEESKSWLYKSHLFANTGYALDLTENL